LPPNNPIMFQIEDLDIGALVSVRGAGRVRIVDIIQVYLQQIACFVFCSTL